MGQKVVISILKLLAVCWEEVQPGILKTGKEAVLLKVFTETQLRFRVLMVETTIHLLLVGGKTVQNQTRVTTNDLFFTAGTGQVLLPMEHLNMLYSMVLYTD